MNEKDDLPLIDLHCHLDGSITPEIAKKLAEIQNIKLPSENDAELEKLLSVGMDCKSLTDFLKCFELPCSLIQTKEAVTLAFKEVQDMLLSQNVIYAEIRFAPQFSCSKGLSQEEVIIAALEGLKQSNLHANIILCCMRGKETHKANFETVELAKKYLVKDGGVVAVDLAGAEALFPTEDYMEEFKLAKKYSVPYTIHAGEAAGPESVWKALEAGTKRIGHGIHSDGDEKLLEKLAEEKVTLEMAPTSNYITKAVNSFDEYPLVKFMQKGIPVTINTDDMAICRTDIKNEFNLIQQKFGITYEQKKMLLRNSCNAAFTDEETKRKLLSFYK